MDDTAPAPSGFDALGTEEQVGILHRVAAEAAPAFGLDVDRVDLVLHGFNTTFRVTTTDARTLALRVGTNSLSGPEQLGAQQAWVQAIATETDVRVPVPLSTVDGQASTAVHAPDAGRTFIVVANGWLDGPDVGECDPEQARALGTVMATLHHQASTWAPPPGTSLPVFDEPLLGDEDRLSTTPLLDAVGRAVVDEARARVRAAFAVAVADRAPIVVHGDLHGGNLKWHEGRLAVFDFDDSGIGVPALDLAVATFYLRRGGTGPVEDALYEGYAAVAEPPATTEETHEALVAGRQLLLVNTLLTSSTPEFRAMAPEYVERTVARLRHWLRSGRFVLDPP